MGRRAAAKGSSRTNNADEATDPAVERAGPKRSRSIHQDDARLPVKRSRKANADEGGAGEAVTKTVGGTSAMGLRPSRNAHPGLLVKATPKRTPAEVAAAHAEKEAAATKKRAAEMQKRDKLASILAIDDATAENEKRKTVRRKSELVEDEKDEMIAKGGPARDGSDKQGAAEGETKGMPKVS